MQHLKQGISNELHAMVMQTVQRLAKEANEKLNFDTPFATPAVTYFNNRAAGGLAHTRDMIVKFNSVLLRTNAAEYFEHIIAHEVAHLVVVHQYRDQLAKVVRVKRPKPHGNRWKFIMQVFGAPAHTTHKMDTSAVPVRRNKKHAAYCTCKKWDITTTRRNKMLRGAAYRAPCCGGKLELHKPANYCGGA